jgi:hypothetical protein
MDLLTPIVARAEWHPNFAALIDRSNEWNSAVLSDWAVGFKDRDGKFVREFQTTFNGCFWELYLNAVLRERQLSIDFTFPSPDFAVTAPWTFAMEATIAGNSPDNFPEHRRADAELPDDLNEFNRQAIIRLSNSLLTKYRKFKSNYAALPHVAGKPFVIALAPFHTPNFPLTCQRAIEALLFNYYIDEEDYIAGSQTDRPIPRGFLSSVQKDNQAPIELGVFQNGPMPEVSAILFSSCATWGKIRALSQDPNPDIFYTALRLNSKSSQPHKVKSRKRDYKETLLDGLRVYHNPEALYPLDPAVFRSPEVFQAYYCLQTGAWVYEQQDGQLLFRIVETLEKKRR